MSERIVAAVHRFLYEAPEGMSLRTGFEPGVAEALAAELGAPGASPEAVLRLLVALEAMFADQPARAPWTAFVDGVRACWRRAGRAADRTTRRSASRARRRLALDFAGPEIEAKATDVRAGALARFVLSPTTYRSRR